MVGIRMTVKFTQTARRLGILSAVSVVILLVAYSITLAMGFMSLESSNQPIVGPLFFMLEFRQLYT